MALRDALSHWIRTRGQFIGGNPLAVHHSALMPRKINESIAMSVFVTEGLSDVEIWALAARYMPPQVLIHGRADFTPADVTAAELSVHIDNEPERHGNVTGWGESKEDWKAHAIALALVATGHRADPPFPGERPATGDK